jgi:gamma-glutamyltranspeptidase/glutathione hydrolase
MRNSTAQAIQRQLKFFEAGRQQEVLAEGRRLAIQAGRDDQAAVAARDAASHGRRRARAKAKGRSAGIIAARDRFYKGDIAAEMVAFLQKHGAPFDASDFAEYYARIEEPAKTTYRGYTVYKHGFGSQGPVLLQALNILENFDLHAMGYASADYLHTVTER